MSDDEWLEENRTLRTDANVDVFPDNRREFHLMRYAFAAPFVADKIVADVACGTGYGSSLLGRSARSVFGIDIALDAVAYARSKYGGDNVRFEVGFAEYTGLASAEYDAVVSFETLEHLIAPAEALEEFCRILKPGGTLIASVPNNRGYTKFHFVDFDFASFRDLINSYFDRAEFFYANSGKKKRFTPKGTGELTPDLANRCECLLVVATGPKAVEREAAKRYPAALRSVYDGALKRHREYLRYERFFRNFSSRRMKYYLNAALKR